MTSASTWRERLIATPLEHWPDFLTTHSNLPGPRGNLELSSQFAELAPAALVETLLSQTESFDLSAGADPVQEYLRMCATVALGRLFLDQECERAAITDRLHTLATSPHWRVREAVAIAMQRVGEEPAVLIELLAAWQHDPHPLVQRARAAAICEPPLLRDEDLAGFALLVCRQATEILLALPIKDRAATDPRVLRKALGYCWSVAIAATPELGLPEFEELRRRAVADADLAWIVSENRKKTRLTKLLPD